METTPNNESGITVTDQLIHSEEARVWCDSVYRGIKKREEHKNRKIDWMISMRPGHHKLSEGAPVFFLPVTESLVIFKPQQFSSLGFLTTRLF